MTLAAGALGGAGLSFAGFPAGWLTGSALTVAVLALSGQAAPMPRRLQQAAFLVIGISMGAGVSPETLERIGEWPSSIAMLLVLVTVSTAGCYGLLHRGFGWDHATAMCGSIPGNLSYVVATAIERGAAVERVAVAHTLRVIVLVALLPPLITTVAPGSAGAVQAPEAAGTGDIAILLATGIPAGIAAFMIRMPGGLLIGAFIISAVLHGSGLVTTVLPSFIVAPTLIVLGTGIGTRFAGIAFVTFLGILSASIASLVTALALCLVPAAAFAHVIGLPVAQTLLAFAPGGLEAMTTLAFVLGGDVAYVAAMHMIRILVLAFSLPLLLNLVEWRARRVAIRSAAGNPGPQDRTGKPR